MEVHGIPLCPSCGGALHAQRLVCPRCATEVHGHFRPALAGLTQEQQAFAERYLAARGNLRELEREMAVSYQSLRAQLDDIALAVQGRSSGGGDVLQRVRRGEIDADRALQLIEALSRGPRADETEDR